MALLGIIPRPPISERANFCSPCSKLRRSFFGLLLLIFSISACGLGHAQQSKEYQLKAAFLYNFAQFVKWPSASFSSADAPFCIGILGDDPFGSALDETIQGEAINNHHLEVERAQRIEDLKGCQMIFICRSEEGRVEKFYRRSVPGRF